MGVFKNHVPFFFLRFQAFTPRVVPLGLGIFSGNPSGLVFRV